MHEDGVSAGQGVLMTQPMAGWWYMGKEVERWQCFEGCAWLSGTRRAEVARALVALGEAEGMAWVTSLACEEEDAVGGERWKAWRPY